ncbi:MAG: hypothetical protein K2K74_04815 [Lachnospiraceae bacterium]|nr:hypothetical protein [Lachnospiraceae bacterium]
MPYSRRKLFSTKNEITMNMLNRTMKGELFQIEWGGCEAAYGKDHEFPDGLELPEGIWYFAVTNKSKQVFMKYPEITFPETKCRRPRKHPVFAEGAKENNRLCVFIE